MSSQETEETNGTVGRFLEVVEKFSDSVGVEPQDIIRRLTASVERSLMAERMRGRFDIRRRR